MPYERIKEITETQRQQALHSESHKKGDVAIIIVREMDLDRFGEEVKKNIKTV